MSTYDEEEDYIPDYKEEEEYKMMYPDEDSRPGEDEDW